MFRRILLPQTRRYTSQALSYPTSFSSSSAVSRTDLSRRFQPLKARQISPARFQRWQSTDTEKKPGDDTSSSTGSSSDGSQPEQSQAENPLRKELDQKNREVIDLKVLPAFLSRCKLTAFWKFSTKDSDVNLPLQLGQVPPLRRRLPQPPGTHAPRHRCGTAICHPALRHRPDRVAGQPRPSSRRRPSRSPHPD